MMNRKSSFGFMLEYLLILMIFIVSLTVTVNLLMKSYSINDLSNRKRIALEYASNYIEKGDYDLSERWMDEYLIRFINTGNNEYEIEVLYENISLVKLPFKIGEVLE